MGNPREVRFLLASIEEVEEARAYAKKHGYGTLGCYARVVVLGMIRRTRTGRHDGKENTGKPKGRPKKEQGQETGHDSGESAENRQHRILQGNLNLPVDILRLAKAAYWPDEEEKP